MVNGTQTWFPFDRALVAEEGFAAMLSRKVVTYDFRVAGAVKERQYEKVLQGTIKISMAEAPLTGGFV